MDVIRDALHARVENVLLVAGVLLFFVAAIGHLTGWFKADGIGRFFAAISGAGLIATSLVVMLVSASLPVVDAKLPHNNVFPPMADPSPGPSESGQNEGESRPVRTTEVVAPRPAPEFSFRQWVSGNDQHIPALVPDEGEPPTSPGRVVRSFSVPNRGPFLVGSGWCARSLEILFHNLARMDFVLVVNGQALGVQDMSDARYTDLETGDECNAYGGILSFADPGEHRVAWITRVKEGLNDGRTEYQAGDYVMEYVVTVR